MGNICSLVKAISVFKNISNVQDIIAFRDIMHVMAAGHVQVGLMKLTVKDDPVRVCSNVKIQLFGGVGPPGVGIYPWVNKAHQVEDSSEISGLGSFKVDYTAPI